MVFQEYIYINNYVFYRHLEGYFITKVSVMNNKNQLKFIDDYEERCCLTSAKEWLLLLITIGDPSDTFDGSRVSWDRDEGVTFCIPHPHCVVITPS